MLFGGLGPLLRPLSRRLAAAGWCCAAVGLAAGLMVAVGSGVRVSAAMAAIQSLGIGATAAASILLTLAALSQPATDNNSTAAGSPGEFQDDHVDAEWQSATAAAHVRSFLLAAVAMLVAVVGFAVAGWMQPNGPSPQSMAFSQIFLLGAATCGLTFMMLHKVAPSHRGRTDS
ncbi:hypothetical protein [Arthrobacter sp. M4]|uniref:hypothetical protein n=1 Tax=Arthrobacter sp. M4 TaxID=218160 RepID=UPI001CDC8948|nr:hypothetical protein [Arthrobacter sp. M4]MCA4132885.1 hypothetical protein [Arthrobacter sp. M4]